MENEKKNAKWKSREIEESQCETIYEKTCID